MLGVRGVASARKEPEPHGKGQTLTTHCDDTRRGQAQRVGGEEEHEKSELGLPRDAGGDTKEGGQQREEGRPCSRGAGCPSSQALSSLPGAWVSSLPRAWVLFGS